MFCHSQNTFLVNTQNDMKELLRAIIEDFLQETHNMREVYIEGVSAPGYRDPTFKEFIDWLQ